MATKTRRELITEITGLCEQAGCNDKIAGIHQAQFVDRGWHPHPPREFVHWWPRGKAICEQQTGMAYRHIDDVRAYNCENVRRIWHNISIITWNRGE